MKTLALILLSSAIVYGQAFPGRAATNADLLVASNKAQSTLAAPMSPTDTTITVANASTFSAFNIITVDNEQIKICSITGNNLTVCSGGRAFGGTTAASHSSAAPIYNYVAAAYHNNMSVEIQSVENWLLGGNVWRGGNFLAMQPIGNTTTSGISSTTANTFQFGNGVIGNSTADVFAGKYHGDGSLLTGITFSPGFSGATPVGLNGWLNGLTLDITECGASTASADNSGAINNCIIKAQSLGIGELQIPAGTWRITGKLIDQTKVRLKGRGRGDAGAIGLGGFGTVLQASGSFPSTDPVFLIGQNADDPIFYGGISDLTIDCQGKAGYGVYDFFGEEMTTIHDVAFYNCGSHGLVSAGALNPAAAHAAWNADLSKGAAQNQGPYSNLEFYPGSTANTNTLQVEGRNLQNHRGYNGITIAEGGFTTKAQYCASLSGVTFSVDTLNLENCGHNGAGLLLFPTGSIGGFQAKINNVNLGTGAEGTVVEIANTQSSVSAPSVNKPRELQITNVHGGNGATCRIMNDINGHCYSSSVLIGDQSNGDMSYLAFGFNDLTDWRGQWITHKPYEIWTDDATSDGKPCQFDIRSPAAGFRGPCFHIDAAGTHITPDLGDGDWLWQKPYTYFAMSGDGSKSGLNIGGHIQDAQNNVLAQIANNIWWDHTNQNWQVGNDTSGCVEGAFPLNAGGFHSPSSVGGMALVARCGISPGQHTQDELNGWYNAIFVPDGTIQIPDLSLDPIRTPPAGSSVIYSKGGQPCVKSSAGVIGCGAGTGGGGGTGGVSSVQLNGVALPIVGGAVNLQLPATANGTGTVAQQNGTGNTATLQINITHAIRTITANDGATGSDCEGIVLATNSSAITETLPQPTTVGVALGCGIRFITSGGTSTLTISATNATIQKNVTMNQAAGTNDCTATAVGSSTWKLACASN